MKPDLSQCIRFGRINLVAISLAYIFKLRFSKEIGLKFCEEVGTFPGFGWVIICGGTVRRQCYCTPSTNGKRGGVVPVGVVIF